MRHYLPRSLLAPGEAIMNQTPKSVGSRFTFYRLGNTTFTRMDHVREFDMPREHRFQQNGKEFVYAGGSATALQDGQYNGVSLFNAPQSTDPRRLWLLPEGSNVTPGLAIVQRAGDLNPTRFLVVPADDMPFESYRECLREFGKTKAQGGQCIQVPDDQIPKPSVPDPVIGGPETHTSQALSSYGKQLLRKLETNEISDENERSDCWNDLAVITGLLAEQHARAKDRREALLASQWRPPSSDGGPWAGQTCAYSLSQGGQAAYVYAPYPYLATPLMDKAARFYHDSLLKQIALAKQRPEEEADDEIRDLYEDLARISGLIDVGKFPF